MVLPNFHSHSPFPPRRLFICFYLSLIEFIQFSNSHTPLARCHNEVESWEMWNEKSFAFFIFSVLLARTKIEIGNRLVRWWWRRWWRRRAFPASRSHTIVQFSKFHTPHSNNLDSSPRSLTSLIPLVDITCSQKRVYCWFLLIYLSGKCSKFREKAINFYHKWSFSMDKSIGKYFKYGKLFSSFISSNRSINFVEKEKSTSFTWSGKRELKWKYCAKFSYLCYLIVLGAKLIYSI